MCHNIKIISKVRNGELSLCMKCNVYHLSFNNLFFEFSTEELNNFKGYIFKLEVDYWEHKYEYSKIKRKIPIPSMQQNLFLMFDRYEIEELKTLFSNQKRGSFTLLNVDNIDYTYVLN